MEMAPFDRRGYPVVPVEAGYADWADHYEATVAVGLDGPLLDRLASVAWGAVGHAIDLACGTGRTGAWLAQHGVRVIDGVDITPAMLAIARTKNAYRSLQVGDATATGLPSAGYDLCTFVLADEHLAELGPIYREVARLLRPGGSFVLVGYHPFFLMNGIPTHYNRLDGQAVTIQSYVHLFSEHHASGGDAGLSLVEFKECVIDEQWLLTKPKWRRYLYWPVSFALVWRRNG
jgi:SAM-dependent methyltransferase